MQELNPPDRVWVRLYPSGMTCTWTEFPGDVCNASEYVLVKPPSALKITQEKQHIANGDWPYETYFRPGVVNKCLDLIGAYEITVQDAIDVIKAYGFDGFGPLHITLDDGNMDDDSIAFCEKVALEEGDWEAVAICHLMYNMDAEQLEELYMRYNEYR